MNELFGIFRRDGAPVERAWMAALAGGAPNPDAQPPVEWYGDGIAVGIRTYATTPEAEFETFPLVGPSGDFVLMARARLDNRAELCDLFQIPHSQRAVTPDTALLFSAYAKWGRNCPDHLRGDWVLAAWDPRTRELFHARDRQGSTALHYFCDDQHFAFASSLKTLLALPFVPHIPNPLYVAKILTAWYPNGTETAYQQLYRLPPAHTLTVSAKQVQVRRYWFLEHAPDVRFKRDEEYVEQFRALFTAAIRGRVRANAPLAAMLSGGLDSGSVCAAAARELAACNQSLTTYTSVPLTPVRDQQNRFGDESEFVAQTRAFVPNLTVNPVRADDVSPIQGITRLLEILGEPTHATGNAFWLVALFQQAQRGGSNVLLSGQGGNATTSWEGSRAPALLHFAAGRTERGRDALREAYLKTGLWRTLRSQFAAPLVHPIRTKMQPRSEPDWHSFSAIQPAFAAELQLAQRMRAAGHDPAFRPPQNPRHARLAIVRPGRSQLGAVWQALGGAYGLEVRDPLLDPRLAEFCLGVPEEQYMRGDQDRLLIRRAMQGYLPDSVRLNPRRGRQAADLVFRLVQHRAEMEQALADLRASPSAHTMLDLDHMQSSWEHIQARSDAETFNASQAILTRGVMVGKFLLTFEQRGLE